MQHIEIQNKKEIKLLKQLDPKWRLGFNPACLCLLDRVVSAGARLAINSALSSSSWLTSNLVFLTLEFLVGSIFKKLFMKIAEFPFWNVFSFVLSYRMHLVCPLLSVTAMTSYFFFKGSVVLGIISASLFTIVYRFHFKILGLIKILLHLHVYRWPGCLWNEILCG